MRRRVPLDEFELEPRRAGAAALAALTDSRLVTADEGDGRGRARSTPQRVAAAPCVARGGRRGPAAPPAPDPRRARLGRRRAATPASSTAARGSRPRSTGPPGHERDLNELERAFLDESRAEAEHEAEHQRRTNRRLRALLAGLAGLLALALVAGIVALNQRGEARDAARVADAQRLGVEALGEDRLDQALLRTRTAVELDESTGDPRQHALRAAAQPGGARGDRLRLDGVRRRYQPGRHADRHGRRKRRRQHLRRREPPPRDSAIPDRVGPRPERQLLTGWSALSRSAIWTWPTPRGRSST